MLLRSAKIHRKRGNDRKDEPPAMKAIEITKGIYWVGVVDWTLRSFHGYTTSRGSSYNAYLILDEKVTLIDTVKHGFENEMLERIKSVIDPEKIDYVVSNHVEPDHSGGIPFIMKYAKNAKVVTSMPNGLKGLRAHYGEFDYQPVKTGESISIGKRTLSFLQVPMLHWPDSMMTYCPEEKILFSNDGFGQHLAASERFDDENDLSIVIEEAQKYYANILMLYGRQAAKALTDAKDFDIQMIATGHGVLWRKNVAKIVELYKKWSAADLDEKAVVVYDTMWHSTEKMARTITEALRECGISVKLFDIKTTPNSDIISELLISKYLAVGSPTLNNQMMPTIAGFLTYFKGLSPRHHKAFAFGSYGWGGQSIGLIEDELKAAGCEIILDKMRIQEIPSTEQLEEVRQSVLAYKKA